MLVAYHIAFCDASIFMRCFSLFLSMSQKSYRQFLEPFRSVTLHAMSEAFARPTEAIEA